MLTFKTKQSQWINILRKKRETKDKESKILLLLLNEIAVGKVVKEAVMQRIASR
jgi:hypothetical protein